MFFSPKIPKSLAFRRHGGPSCEVGVEALEFTTTVHSEVPRVPQLGLGLGLASGYLEDRIHPRTWRTTWDPPPPPGR